MTATSCERARRDAACHVFPIGAITKGSEGEEIAPIGSMKRGRRGGHFG